MYTVLVLLSTPSMVSYHVEHFQTKAEAEAYKPSGIHCTAETVAIYEGHLSDEEAICEYLD